MKVPFYKQQTPYSCALACLRMVLESIDKKTTEYELSKIIGFDPDVGFSPEMMRQTCEKINVKCKIQFENTLERLKELTSRDVFPIVLLNPSMLYSLEHVEYKHYIVIKDITGENVIINDPDQEFGGENKQAALHKFVETWKSVRNMLIIVGDEK